MKNIHYVENQLRVIVDNKGRNVLASPDGDIYPNQISSVISQDIDQSKAGICHCIIEMLISYPGFLPMMKSARVDADGIDGRPIIKFEIISPPDTESAVIAKIFCIASLDRSL